MNGSEIITKLLLELRMDAEALGKSIGKKDGDTIRNVLLKRNRLSPKLARLIADKHKISYKWLMIGEGEIFESETKKVEQKSNPGLSGDKDQIIKILLERIEEQKEIIKYQAKYIEDMKRSEVREPGKKDTG